MNSFIEGAADAWSKHGTKLLGTAASVVSTAMLIPELIPAGQLKYWLFANALLGGGVVKRGFTNSKPEASK